MASGPARAPARPLRFRHPAQFVVGGFAGLILIGTALLSLPVATAGPGGAPLGTAFFSAVASATLTGVSVVEVATYWSPTGQAIILGLIQLGGLGIVTSASLLFLLVARRVGLRGRMVAQAETRTLDLGGIRRLIIGIISFTLAFQAITVVVLTARLWLGTGRAFGTALWEGAFHGVAAVNNAGISIFPEGLTEFGGDGWILVTIALAVIVGGLGFPVWLNLWRLPRSPSRWSLHAKLTLTTTAALLAFGVITLTAMEWSNEATLGAMDVPNRLLSGFFTGVMPRTAGFNVIDYSEANQDSLLVTDMLMFAGGGSGSVAGGIKVTTFALLFLVVWAEIRGEPDVNAFGRRIPQAVQRQALTIAVIAVNAVVIGTLVVISSNDLSLSQALFECMAAFSTAGIGTETTAGLDGLGRAVLIVLMFLGRVGPLTLAVALVLRERERLYSNPDERPLVG
jgi:Trk-type K+ transport system membrane component